MSAHKKTSSQTRNFHLETMEERILFSADAAFAVVDTAPVPFVDVSLQQEASNEESIADSDHYYLKKELVIVDSSLPDVASLLDELDNLNSSEYEIVVLDNGEDAITRIGNILSEQSELSAVHLLSHGANGQLQLGADTIDTMELLSRAEDIAAWKSALLPGADFLLYGCDVAADGNGQDFVDTFARLTGADVSASIDLTGATAKGGDWALEYQRGKLETDVVVSQEFQTRYNATLAIFTVTSLDDSGAGTLREAMTNAISGDSIEFDIAGTITLVTALPTVNVQLTIDGTSAPAYVDAPLVTLDGTNLPGNVAAGVHLGGGSDGSIIRGLSIVNFPQYGVVVDSSGSHAIQSNYIGTDGSSDLGNGGGISLLFSSGNTIGGDRDAGEGNLISGNSVGIDIVGSTATNNLVYGNDIGTNAAITSAIGNDQAGVRLSAGASSNEIGGIRTNGWGNTISGNGVGVILTGGTTNNNQLFGNRIGLSYDNLTVIGNTGDGIQVLDGSSNNLIGGPENGEGQTVSGNNRGIFVSGIGTSNNLIQWSWIGLGGAGNTTGFGNTTYGVEISNGATNNTIGGAKGNTIGGNAIGIGINGAGTSSNIVQANIVGVDTTGTIAVPNSAIGIEIKDGAASNTIGGDVYNGEGNVVSGNLDGIVLSDGGTDNNIIEGNRIGLHSDFTSALGNTGDGVRVESGASNNTIGHATFGRGNFIGANINGVVLKGSGTDGNSVLGNHIGSGFFGTEAIGNAAYGVLIEEGASNNIIGDAVGRNYILDNDVGVGIWDSGTSSNTVLGNHIGVVRGNAAAIANTSYGIQISNAATGNTIGTTSISSAERNHISGNGVGIDIGGNGTNTNTVIGNIIGLDGTYEAAMGNSAEGIRIHSGASNNVIGGSDANELNIVSGNQTGIYVGGANTTGNELNWNYVGLSISGTTAVGNIGMGISITDAANNNLLGENGWLVVSANDVGISVSGNGTTGNSIKQSAVGFDGTFQSGMANNNEGIKIHSEASTNVVDGVAVGTNAIGISISGNATDNNIVRNSAIGLNAVGTGISGNTNFGVLISDGAKGNLIGGDSWETGGNIIVANGQGVGIQGSGTENNSVSANQIGLDDQYTGTYGNNANGVLISGGAQNNTIGGSTAGQGNIISDNDTGITIDGASNNFVLGNKIGTNIDGSAGMGNLNSGIEIINASQNNSIGGVAANAGNIISDNEAGVVISGANTSGNTLYNNYIGTDFTGAQEIGNANAGVLLDTGASSNVIGGDNRLSEGNLISGNAVGVEITGSNTSQNSVQGNYIGTTASGLASLGNLGNGIDITMGASDNLIGGANILGFGNLISANTGVGIFINGAQTSDNQIFGNLIGTDINGTSALGNASHGVFITDAVATEIGSGLSAGLGNTISANGADGIHLIGAESTYIQSNYIGTDSNGVSALGNAGFGVVIGEGSSLTLLGGNSAAGQQNVIADNSMGGVKVDGADSVSASTIDNTIQGNLIGLDISGQSALPNGAVGVMVTAGAENTSIGGDSSLNQGNVIAGHSVSTDIGGLTVQMGDGIIIDGVFNTQIQGNLVGLASDGITAMGNFMGIRVNDATGASIGGALATDSNTISGNLGAGVYLGGTASTGVVVLGNRIGTTVNGRDPLGNNGTGISIVGNNYTVGTASAPNIISANTGDGVSLVMSVGNSISGNYIGVAEDGLTALGNGGSGISISTMSTTNFVGGFLSGEGNLIQHNSGAGVSIPAESAMANLVIGNSISSNTGIAIDLGIAGSDFNDAGDGDTGANDLQNKPTVDSAVTDGASVVEVSVSLNSAADTQYRIDFYGSNVADGSGIGGSDNYLGHVMLTTDASGYGAIADATLSVELGIGAVINATATSTDGDGALINTSEVSDNFVALELNAAPIITSNNGDAVSSVNVFENQTNVVTVTASDANGHDIAYSISGGNDANRFSINATTGDLSFISPPDFENPQGSAGGNVYEVIVEATDEQGAAASQQLVVIVSNANEAPAGDAVINVTSDENQALVSTVAVTDAENDQLLYSIVGGADAALFTVDQLSGDIRFNSVPNFEAPTDAGADNSYELMVAANDQLGGVFQQQFVITVLDVNDAPSADATFTISADEKQNYATTVVASDPDGDSLSFAIVGGVDSDKFNIDSETGVLQFVSAPLFASPVDANSDNVYEVLLAISDNFGGTVQQQISVVVNDVNEAPEIDSTLEVSVNENQIDVATVSGTDFENGDLIYAISGGADAAHFDINVDSGAVTFKNPVNFDVAGDNDSNNVYEVDVTVSDNEGASAVQSISVTVIDLNERPELAETENVTVGEYQTVATTINAVDPEGDVLHYAIVGGEDADLFTLDAQTGILSFNQPPDYELPVDTGNDNIYQLQIEVTDPTDGLSAQQLSITVIDGNDAPVAQDDTMAVAHSTKLVIDPVTALLANDRDPEGGELTLVDFTLPEHGVLILSAEGFLEYNPALDFSGTDTFEYVIEDDVGNQATATVNIDVQAPIAPIVAPAVEAIVTKPIVVAPATPSTETTSITSVTSLPTATTLTAGTGLDTGTTLAGVTSVGPSTATAGVASTPGVGSSDGGAGDVVGVPTVKEPEPGEVTVTETVSEAEKDSATSAEENQESGEGEKTEEELEEEAQATDSDEVIKKSTKKFASDKRFGMKESVNTDHRSALKDAKNTTSSTKNSQSGQSGTTASAEAQNAESVELSESQQVSVLQSVFNLNMSPQARTAELNSAIDSIRRQVTEVEEETTRAEQAVALAPKVLAPSITVGIVTWVLRSGLLVAATISTTPVWRQLDLVPILAEDEDDSDEEDDELIRDLDEIKSESDETKKSGDAHE